MAYPMTPPDDDEALAFGRTAHVPAPAVLKRTAVCWHWVVPKCPLCGKKHTHGGGRLDQDPRRLLGHRVPHCPDPPDAAGSYELVEAVR
jgi:hypothetical protein